MEMLAARNPSADPNDLVAHGWPALRELCERYVAVGFSKLVLVPFTEPDDWDDELAAGARSSPPDPELSSSVTLRGSGGGRSSSRATPMHGADQRARAMPITNTSWELA